MGFSRLEYWSGLPCLPPGDFPGPGIKPTPLTSPALAGGSFTTSTAWEAQYVLNKHLQLQGGDHISFFHHHHQLSPPLHSTPGEGT